MCAFYRRHPFLNTEIEICVTNEELSGNRKPNAVVVIGFGDRESMDARFQMPIKKDPWLYKYMVDKDNDGMVGE